MYVQFSGGGVAAVQCTGLVWRRLRADAQTLACPQLGSSMEQDSEVVFYDLAFTLKATVHCGGSSTEHKASVAATAYRCTAISMSTNWEFHGAELRGLFKNLAFTLQATVYFLQEVCEYSPKMSFWCKTAI